MRDKFADLNEQLKVFSKGFTPEWPRSVVEKFIAAAESIYTGEPYDKDGMLELLPYLDVLNGMLPPRSPVETVEMAIWEYRAGYGTKRLARILRNSDRLLSVIDRNSIADFIEGKFKLGKGTTLAAARRAEAKSFIFRHAAYEVDKLKKQWRAERGPRHHDHDKAIDKVVKQAPQILSEVFFKVMMDELKISPGRGLSNLSITDEVMIPLIPLFEKKMSIRLNEFQPHVFEQKLRAFMRKPKKERKLTPFTP